MEEQKLKILQIKYNKHVLMTVLSIIASAMAYGIPTSWLQIKVFAVTVGGILITYIPKDFLLPSTSVNGKLNWKDYLSAFIMGLSGGISSWTASSWFAASLDWKGLITVAITTAGGYLYKVYNTSNSLN